MPQPLTPSFSRTTTGELLAADLTRCLLMDHERRFHRPRGLIFRKSGAAVRVRLVCGDPNAGTEVVRTFTLTETGVWLVVGGWSTVRAIVEAIGGTTVVSYAWTLEPPPEPPPLFFIESIVAGTRNVPAGATALKASNADAGWSWSTDQDGAGAITVNAAIPAGGAKQDVAGDQYMATGINTVCWFLSAP